MAIGMAILTLTNTSRTDWDTSDTPTGYTKRREQDSRMDRYYDGPIASPRIPPIPTPPSQPLIPDDVYQRAYEAGEFNMADFKVIADWAWREGMLDAAKIARATTLTLNDIGYETETIAEVICDEANKYV